jgi:HPr kinase/phosphorylase
MLARGFELVADDQVLITDGVVSAPAALAGLLEVRGLGIVQLPHRTGTRLALIIDLAKAMDRLPMPRQHPELGVPIVCIDGGAASAPDRVALALDCATGKIRQVAGAFAA